MIDYEDPRKTGLKTGLRQLTNTQIQRVLDYPPEAIAVDHGNYVDGKFCPLAIGLGVDLWMDSPTNEKVVRYLESLGLSVYNTRGVAGAFYTTNRLEDLRSAAIEVLHERGGIG